jgi:hypothetical protein
LFIRLRKAALSFMHVDEDVAEPATRILAGPEIDLVAADAGLLGVALSASGKRFSPDETREARDGGFVGGNGVRLARLIRPPEPRPTAGALPPLVAPASDGRRALPRRSG